jgi:hypothetical protein
MTSIAVFSKALLVPLAENGGKLDGIADIGCADSKAVGIFVGVSVGVSLGSAVVGTNAGCPGPGVGSAVGVPVGISLDPLEGSVQIGVASHVTIVLIGPSSHKAVPLPEVESLLAMKA